MEKKLKEFMSTDLSLEDCDFVKDDLPFDWLSPFDLVAYIGDEWVSLDECCPYSRKEIVAGAFPFFVVQNDIYYWPATFQVDFAGPDAKKVM
jgi:hypothetical protein